MSFEGIERKVSLSHVPDASIGEYVLVHVGFAIGRIDEEEAHRVLNYLREMGELQELREDEPPPP